jgi:hypothetical protein
MTMIAIRSSMMASASRKGCRDRASQQGADAEREADIRGRGDRPAAQGFGTAPIQRHIDGGRHHEAPDRRDDRQCGLAQACKRALAGLALDLETDQQKKDRHQPVVDPMLERLGQADRSDPHLAGLMQQGGVMRLEGRIGDHQGGERRRPERHTPVKIGPVALVRCCRMGFGRHETALRCHAPTGRSVALLAGLRQVARLIGH